MSAPAQGRGTRTDYGPGGLADRACPPPVMTHPSRLRRASGATVRLLVSFYLLAIVAAIVVYKAAFVDAFLGDPFFATYGIAVSAYLVSPRPPPLPSRPPADVGLEPHVAIVMPAFNE